MTISKLDQIYRSILLSKYFTKGWGSPENLKRLLQFRKIFSSRESCNKLIGDHYPLEFTKDEIHGDVHILEGLFTSPFDLYLPSLLPKESKTAYFQMILPKHWKYHNYRPVCIHFAGTGDHYFWRRRNFMAKPLLKEAGIGAILLENPFYGTRKPVYQTRSVLNNVSDIFVMGGCLILEAIVLLRWCQRQGFGPLGVTGLSMGGHMASLVATNWPHPLVLVPCLSSLTASGVFTEGVMSRAINWDMLESQYKENEAFLLEIERMIEIRKTDAFQAGQEFVKNFPESMTRLKQKESDIISTVSIKRNLQNNSSYCLREESYYNESTDIFFKKKDNINLLRDDHLAKNKIDHILKSGAMKVEGESSLKKTLTKVFSSFSTENNREYEAINFMRGIMDECTHLKNFSVPVDTSLVISVCARDDAYVPYHGDSGLSDIWPEAEVRFIDAGHVSGFILYQKAFRKAIIEAFKRYNKKYNSSYS